MLFVRKVFKRLLKAPATASFPNIDQINVKTVKRLRLEGGADEIHFNVTGFVDAQNSFGAKLRNSFVCSAIGQTGKNWKVKSSLV